MFVHFMAIQSILLPFRILYGHLVGVFCGHFGIFSGFGIFYREKSGNPALNASMQ
jgi:hypothetical protein